MTTEPAINDIFDTETISKCCYEQALTQYATIKNQVADLHMKIGRLQTQNHLLRQAIAPGSPLLKEAMYKRDKALNLISETVELLRSLDLNIPSELTDSDTVAID